MIALVISIIVMLILSGVSINAVIGENGIISRATNANFINEMTAVQEALDIWKAANKIDNLDSENLPYKGVITTDILYEHDRLYGEIAYYRAWADSDMPDTSITLPEDSFNNTFIGDLYGIGNKIFELHFLDLEQINYKSKYDYIIDESNGMIYRLEGIEVGGVKSVHSLDMFKAVESGKPYKPNFIASNSERTEDDIIYAGSGKYLTNGKGEYVDKNGNVVSEENKVLNPDGFTLYANYTNDNLYKLYNNGELYAKGKKGIQINSDDATLESLNSAKWLTSNVPSIIPGADANNVEIIVGYQTIFVIDQNNDLWAWGKNTRNIMGLDDEKLNEYSSLVPQKLSVDGKKIKKIFPTRNALFVITQTNELYACGANESGELGIGSKGDTQTNKFIKVNFVENVNNIKKVCNWSESGGVADNFNFIITTTGNIYFSGKHSAGRGENVKLTENATSDFITTYTLVDKLAMFPNLNTNDVNCTGFTGDWAGSVWYFYNNTKCYAMSANGSVSEVTAWETTGVTGIEIANSGWTSSVIAKITKGSNVEYWVQYAGSSMGFSNSESTSTWTNKTDYFSMNETATDKIVKFWTGIEATFIQLNSGKVYGCGNNVALGLGESVGISQWKEIPVLTGLNSKFKFFNISEKAIVVSDTGVIYGSNCVDLIKREEVLEKQWKLIATDVKYFNATNEGDNFGIVKNDGKLYVKGNNSNWLGMNLTDSKVTTLTEITGVGATEEVQSAINSGIKDYAFTDDCMYVLTESGYLLVSSSDNIKNGSWTSGYNGTGVLENPVLTIVQKNVISFQAYGCHKISRTTDGVYYWGADDASGLGNHRTPRKLDDVWNDAGDWLGNMLTTVYIWVVGENGVVATNSTESGIPCEHTNQVSGGRELVLTEKMKTGCWNGAMILLGTSGDLYGWGVNAQLGNNKGQDGSSTIDKLEKIDAGHNFVQIVGGNGWAIGVTKDGKVYGTGKNEFGILGKWKNGANKVKTRYKTSYTWVECPELEI